MAQAQDARKVEIGYEITFAGFAGFRIDFDMRVNGRTVKAVAEARQAELEVGVQSDPLVRAVLERFPGAQIVRVRGQSDAAAPPPAAMEALPPAEEEMSSDDDGFGENWVRDDGGE